ncbi:hypothetical protein FJZ48_01700 [Candidatus Uhrbacteria bacterium]|nr:hypothetical protein [Candidatus Uhrbacteria bacterium]
MIFLRAVLFSIPRHLVIILALTAIQNFDFHPLPLWTAIAVTYFFQWVITWFFAEWTFWHRLPRFKEMLMVFCIFLVMGTLIEVSYVSFLIRVDWWKIFTSVLQWDRLYLVATYFLAVSIAAFHVRRRHVKAKLPEGLESC